jgi:hypothetical protein
LHRLEESGRLTPLLLREALNSYREYSLSAWVRTDRTTATVPLVLLFYASATDKQVLGKAVISLPVDQPWWTRVTTTAASPVGAAVFRLFVGQPSMKEGTVWLDDLSLRSKGSSERVKDGGFEERN